MTTLTATPPGWYTDPTRRHEFRYWDGEHWTDDVSDRGVTAHDPVEGTPPPMTFQPMAPHQMAPQQMAPQQMAPQQMAPQQMAPQQMAPQPFAAAPAPTSVPVHHGHAAVWITLTVIVAVIALLGGLLLWSPWSRRASGPPPEALTTMNVDADSVELIWSHPSGAGAPTQYLILRDGAQVAEVAGTVTRYEDTGLAPATMYSYEVTARYADHESPPSPAITVTTDTPAVSAARLDGTWTVRTEVTRTGGGDAKVGDKDREVWSFTPRCADGPCDRVVLSGELWSHPFKATLERQGAVYTGSDNAHITHCGLMGSVNVRNTVTVRLTVKDGVVEGDQWVADSFSGRLTLESPYTSAGMYYCPAQTVALALTSTQ